MLTLYQGIFRHLDSTRLAYYRLLGAKIGKNVIIEKGTTLGEYDLIEIGDNSHLDRCVCRPFAVERNTSMFLGRIVIGKNSAICLKAQIAAGSTLPANTYVGANSSSYEMDDESNEGRGTTLPSKPHVLTNLFCIIPIQAIVLFISSLPWMFGLWGIVSNEVTQSDDSVRMVITWWATLHRISFHYLAMTLNVAVRPFVWFACIVMVKKALNSICGSPTLAPMQGKSQKQNFRTHLLAALIPGGSLKSITKLFGTHYEFTSIAVRALGGKIGKRVYWPGTGPSVTDFDLLEVGDDVVFGSRSHIVTGDSFGNGAVRIGNGAMIADRVILSPGSTVGDGAVLGSGAFIKRDQLCAPSTVWVGNRNGSAVCLSNTSSKTPTLVGRAESEQSSLRKHPFSSEVSSKGTSVCESPIEKSSDPEKEGELRKIIVSAVSVSQGTSICNSPSESSTNINNLGTVIEVTASDKEITSLPSGMYFEKVLSASYNSDISASPYSRNKILKINRSIILNSIWPSILLWPSSLLCPRYISHISLLDIHRGLCASLLERWHHLYNHALPYYAALPPIGP
jgi:acetyltransferase-like isoleucine patch superfamily enzyme